MQSSAPCLCGAIRPFPLGRAMGSTRTSGGHCVLSLLMSRFGVVPTHWLRHHGLSVTDKAVLCVLATYADEARYCYPAVKTLADDLCVSPRTVQYSLRALVNAGAVLVESRRTAQGDLTTNGYWITGYDLLERVVQPIARGGATDCTTSCNPLHPNSTNKQDQLSEASPTPPTTAEWPALVFPNALMGEAYLRLWGAARSKAGFDASLKAVLEGLTTGKPCTIEELGAALLDMAGNGEAFNLARLRGYLRKAQAAAKAEGQPGAPAPRSGALRWTMTDEERAQMVRELDAEIAAEKAAKEAAKAAWQAQQSTRGVA